MDIPKEETICNICMDPFTGEIIGDFEQVSLMTEVNDVLVNACNNVENCSFHRKCIRKSFWAYQDEQEKEAELTNKQQPGHHSDCPLCRRKFSHCGPSWMKSPFNPNNAKIQFMIRSLKPIWHPQPESDNISIPDVDENGEPISCAEQGSQEEHSEDDMYVNLVESQYFERPFDSIDDEQIPEVVDETVEEETESIDYKQAEDDDGYDGDDEYNQIDGVERESDYEKVIQNQSKGMKIKYAAVAEDNAAVSHETVALAQRISGESQKARYSRDYKSIVQAVARVDGRVVAVMVNGQFRVTNDRS